MHVAVQCMYCSILLGLEKAHISQIRVYWEHPVGGEDPHFASSHSCVLLVQPALSFEGKPSCEVMEEEESWTCKYRCLISVDHD